jgi:hypothetical protein
MGLLPGSSLWGDKPQAFCFLSQFMREQVKECAPGTTEPGFNSSCRDAQASRDLCLRQSFQIILDEKRTRLWWKQSKGFLHKLRQFLTFKMLHKITVIL